MEIVAAVFPITAILAGLVVCAVRAVRRHGLAHDSTHLWAVAVIGWGTPVVIVWSRLLMSYGT